MRFSKNLKLKDHVILPRSVALNTELEFWSKYRYDVNYLLLPSFWGDRFSPLQSGIQNGCHEKFVCINLKQLIYFFPKKLVVLEANRLEPRSGPT